MKVWLSTCVGVLLLAGIGTVWGVDDVGGELGGCQGGCSGNTELSGGESSDTPGESSDTPEESSDMVGPCDDQDPCACEDDDAGGNGPGGGESGDGLGGSTDSDKSRSWTSNPWPLVASEYGTGGGRWPLLNPVVYHNGEFSFGVSDLRWPHDGTWFSTYRKYGSDSSSRVGDFGVGTESNLRMYASYAVEGPVHKRTIHFSEDKEIVFTATSAFGDYEPAAGWGRYRLAFAAWGDNHLMLVDRNGYTYHFEAPAGGMMVRTRNRYGEGEDYVYDQCSAGDPFLLTQVSLHDSSGMSDRHIVFERDCYISGVITKIYDNYTGRTVDYEYDTAKLTRVSGICASCNVVPEVYYEYAATDKITKIKDGTANTLYEIEYALSDVSRITDPDGGTNYYGYDGSAQTAFVCDAVDNTYEYRFDDYTMTKKKILMEAGESDDIVYDYKYDADFNLAQIVKNNSLTTNRRYTSRQQLGFSMLTDASGNTLTTFHVLYSPNNRISEFYDAYGNTTSYTYDSHANLIQVVRPDSTTKQYSHTDKGLVSTYVNASGRTSEYSYSDLGFRVSKTVDTNGGLSLLTEYTVDELGRKLAIRSPEGIETHRWYDVGGHVTLTESGGGISTQYSYDENGRLTLELDNAGGATEYTKQYAYDVAGNLVTLQVGPSGSERTTVLDYDAKGRRISQVAPGNGKAEWVFDKLGRVLTVRVGDTSGTTPISILEYNNMGLLASVKDALLNETTLTYDGFDRIITLTHPSNDFEEYSYDAASRLTKECQFGSSEGLMSKTTTEFDRLGRVTLERDFADAISGTGGDTDPLRRLTYTPDGQISTVALAVDASTSNTTSYWYDGAARMTKVTDPDNGERTFVYDKDGVLTTVADPNGNEKTYVYDDDGRLITRMDELGHYSVRDHDPRGLATEARDYSSTDALLAKTKWAYDVYGRPVTSRAKSDPGGADNDSTDYVTIAEYDAAGRVVCSTDAAGNETTYAYDKYGRVTQSVAPDGSYGMSEYDLNGNVITALGYEIVGANTVSFQQCYEHDVMDRVLRSINQGPDGDFTNTADNLTTSFVYDGAGRLVTITDEGGQVTTYEYDSLGRQEKMTEDAGNIQRVTNYGYDRLSQLKSIIAENSVTGDQTTRYSYNGRGLQTVIDYEETNDVSMFYDLAGNMTQRNDGEHQVDYEFDNLNRLTRRAPYGGMLNIDGYGYDALGRLTGASKITEGMPPGIASSIFSYDSLSRLTKESQSIRCGTARDVQYTYDKAGRQISMQHDDAGLTVAYGYDTRSRCTDIDHYDVYDSEWVQLAEYTWLGNALNKRETTCDYPGATKPKFKTEFARDGLLRVTKAENAHLTLDMAQPAVCQLGAWDYTYDSSSNVLSAMCASGNMGKLRDQRIYAYDTLNRLVTSRMKDMQDWATGWPGCEKTSTYAYDELGNRQSHQYRDAASIAYGHDKANQMTQLAGLGQTYDQAGNQTLGYSADRGSSYRYRYDHNNRLTGVYDGATGTTRKAAYTYDAMGRRIEFINDVTAETVRYYYDGVNEIYETDESGVGQRAYIHGVSYVDERLMMMDLTDGLSTSGEIPGKWYYYLLDSMYNVRGLVDRAGALVERYVYDPYGRPLIRESAGRGDLWMTDSLIDNIDLGLYLQARNGEIWDPRADVNNDGAIDGDDDTRILWLRDYWTNDQTPPTVAQAFSDVGNPYMFQGRPHFALDTGLSAETATLMLNDHRRRFMDVVTGRWLTRDPLGYVDGMNLYESMRSSPLRWSDPMGTTDDDLVPDSMTCWVNCVMGHWRANIYYICDLQSARSKTSNQECRDKIDEMLRALQHDAEKACARQCVDERRVAEWYFDAMVELVGKTRGREKWIEERKKEGHWVPKKDVGLCQMNAVENADAERADAWRRLGECLAGLDTGTITSVLEWWRKHKVPHEPLELANEVAKRIYTCFSAHCRRIDAINWREDQAIDECREMYED